MNDLIVFYCVDLGNKNEMRNIKDYENLIREKKIHTFIYCFLIIYSIFTLPSRIGKRIRIRIRL